MSVRTPRQAEAATHAPAGAGASPTTPGVVERHPLLTFAVTAIALTWIVQFTFLGLGWPLFPALAIEIAVLLATSTWVTYRIEGRAGVRRLYASTLRWRFGLAWYVVALVVLPVSTIGVAAVVGSLTGPADGWGTETLQFLFVAVVFGTLLGNMWEELAWTAFLQDRLTSRHGALKGALATALPFALIHLPLAFEEHGLSGTPGVDIAVTWAFLFAVAPFLRYLLGLVYARTGRSTLAGALLHGSFNASGSLSLVHAGWEHAVALVVVTSVISFVLGRVGLRPPRGFAHGEPMTAHDNTHAGHGSTRRSDPAPALGARQEGGHAVHSLAASDPGSHGAHGGGQAGHGGGHRGHAGHVERFRRLFWVMLLLAVPVVALSPMFAMLVGYEVTTDGVVAWVPPVLGTVLYAWGGSPFLAGAVGELRARRPGMMLLIGLAITVAFGASWGATLGLLNHSLEFWWELALLIVIMLLGHWLEMRSLAQTTNALDSLAALLPDTAEVVRGNTVEKVSPSDLVVGDVVLVRPGGAVPADGRIAEGEAELDESMVTGESRTVRRGVGDQVAAGTVSTDSGLRVEVTATGDDTTLAGIRRLVEQAQNSTSRAQRLADRAAAWLFWYALAAATVTGLAWTLLGEPEQAVARVITVLVIACPHALGLAIPLVVAIATERSARAGVLVKDRLALERMRTITTVVFDKTGTLTKGQPALVGIDLAPGVATTEADMLALAAAAETDSEHPLARAIVRAAADRQLTVAVATGFSSQPALGVTVQVDGSEIRVGGPRLLAEQNVDDPTRASHSDTGLTRLFVIRDRTVLGALTLADEIRPESAQAVAMLHQLGVKVAMITGDARTVAEAVGKALGIDTVLAEVRPEDKAARVAELQAAGEQVAMVGDGVNDAPALAQADVGLAIGAGTDVAIASAGVILAGDDPRSVVSVIRLSKASYRKMQQNLWWAAGYNLVSVPLAAGLLVPVGISLPMEVGAILMSVSTIVVAANAQWLRRLDLRPDRVEVASDAAEQGRR